MLITHEELFLETIQDLRNKINSNKTYDIIRACGLCRHLLVEGHPLAHQVTKKLRCTITFQVADHSGNPLAKIKMHAGWISVEPNASKYILVKLDEFLSIVVLYYHNLNYTVKDIILAASHYYGGIHSGKPKEKQKYLADLDSYMQTDEKASLKAMKNICKVILNAMEPIEAVLNGHTPAGGFSPHSSAA